MSKVTFDITRGLQSKLLTTNSKIAIWSTSNRTFHSTKPIQKLQVKSRYFAPELQLDPLPFLHLDRDVRSGNTPTPKNFLNLDLYEDDYYLNGIKYENPVITPAATVYDKDDDSLLLCPEINTPKIRNLYRTEEDSLRGWEDSNAFYFRDFRNHEKVAEMNDGKEYSYFGGCLSGDPSLMYLDSETTLPPVVAFDHDGMPPLSILAEMNDDIYDEFNNIENYFRNSVEIKHLDISLVSVLKNIFVTIKGRTLDPKFLDIFEVDNSYRGFENMWLLHIWMTLRWLRFRPIPEYATLQEMIYEAIIREAHVANRKFGNISLKFIYHNINLQMVEMNDMFLEFDKALQLSLAGDNHLWYHVLYHHIYRAAESRPVPRTITFKPKDQPHLNIQLQNPPDRASMNLLIQYIHDYLYTYSTMLPTDAVSSLLGFLTLPKSVQKVASEDRLGKLTREEMDIFSRYIHHPSPVERGDIYVNQKKRKMRILMGVTEPKSTIVDEKYYEHDLLTRETMLHAKREADQISEEQTSQESQQEELEVQTPQESQESQQETKDNEEETKRQIKEKI